MSNEPTKPVFNRAFIEAQIKESERAIEILKTAIAEQAGVIKYNKHLLANVELPEAKEKGDENGI